jgi:hypothetical protein
MDINLELLGYLAAGSIEEAIGIAGLARQDIALVCAGCPNQPFPGGEFGEVTFHGK